MRSEDERARRLPDAQAPDEWRQDEAFSAIAYLTPQEMSEAAEKIRRVLAPYLHREQQPADRPVTARPVAVIARLFPLLPLAGGDG